MLLVIATVEGVAHAFRLGLAVLARTVLGPCRERPREDTEAQKNDWQTHYVLGFSALDIARRPAAAQAVDRGRGRHIPAPFRT